MKIIIYTIALGLFTLLISCSKDDEGNASTIKAGTQTFEINGVNNCNTSTGTGSTFVMTIPYTVDSGVTIQKLLIDTKVSDGGSEATRTNTQFTNAGTTVTWAICFRFGSQDWVEYNVRLEGSNGSVSNVSKVRISKPTGAE